MTQALWSAEYAVEAEAAADFTWKYCTDVRNWNDPPAEFELEGPFDTGARGVTRIPGQEPRSWVLRDVETGRRYVIETGLKGATMTFEWCFDHVSPSRTKLTQRITLSGEQAEAYREAVAANFGLNLGPGMERIAAAVTGAAQGVPGRPE